MTNKTQPEWMLTKGELFVLAKADVENEDWAGFVAKAAQHKLVRWLNELCEEGDFLHHPVHRLGCGACMRQLREDVGL